MDFVIDFELDFKIFSNIFDEPITKKDELCCDNMDLKMVDGGHLTCMSCGIVNMDKEYFFTDVFDGRGVVKYIQPYKRCVYFKQKINMINSVTFYPNNPKILYFIECNKGKQFRSINRLKKLMKQANLNIYYKYIYSIYYAITGVKLVTISQREANLYCQQFIKIERYFLKHNMRKNLYSYNVILYMLMKYYNNPTYNKIILPFNKNKLRKIVSGIAVATLTV